MGIINDVAKVEVGRELKSIYENSLPIIVQLDANLKTLTSRYNAMLGNKAEYTEADCTEVKALIDDLTFKLGEILK